MQKLLALTPLGLALSGLFILAVTPACAGRARPSGAAASDAQPHFSSPFRLETAAWSEPYSGPLGYPKGARRASLGIDPRTGGETYYAHFPAGTRFELHWHAYAEYAVVLRGTVTHTLGRENTTMQPGDYIVIPPKTPHGWTIDPSADAYLLIRRDGPADFNFVGR